MATAVVVGSGQQRTAGAVRLAQHGIDVEVLKPPIASAAALEQRNYRARRGARPLLGVPSHGRRVVVLSTLGLDITAWRWRWPEIDCAHPLDTGEAGLLWRSVDETAGASPRRGRWRRCSPAAGLDELADDLMRPIVHLPRHPLRLLRFARPRCCRPR